MPTTNTRRPRGVFARGLSRRSTMTHRGDNYRILKSFRTKLLAWLESQDDVGPISLCIGSNGVCQFTVDVPDPGDSEADPELKIIALRGSQ